MLDVKLQIGCLLVVLYFTAEYMKDTLQKKLPCNGYFDAILIIAPWAIVFDGITAWTVNHMNQVPGWFNMICHALFFILMDMLTVAIFLYIIQMTIGIHSTTTLFMLMIPGIVSITLIILFMDELYYVKGSTTNYSMGNSVYICFASLFLHFLIIFGVILIHHKTIEKKNLFGIIIFMLLALGILVAQLIFPEILMTSLVPAFMVICLYLNFEDPALRRLQNYNANMVTGFATLVENRDNNTGGHINRTREYVRIILDSLWLHPKYRPVLSRDYVMHVLDAAPMHDIGKIATPDHILQKPGKLTVEEYEIMKEHAKIGGEIIEKTFSNLDDPDYEKIAYEVARHHHEKWNGTGYPDGLSEEKIPLHARIMAIADVFDAISARRCYRDAMPLEKCFRIIEEGAGTDFDPDLVDLFLGKKKEIVAYYNQSKKTDSDLL